MVGVTTASALRHRAMYDLDTPSVSARLVAAMRGLGASLPAPARDLAPDTVSVHLAGFPFSTAHTLVPAFLKRALLAHCPSLRRATLSMALRSRAIDDVVRAFVANGGAQVLLLGAGLDARSVRLAHVFGDRVTLYEVDSPGSQRAKRAALARLQAQPATRLRFVAHDFELEALDAMPLKLSTVGLNASLPTCIVLEGVCQYLSAEAVDATLEVVKKLGNRKSLLVINHLDPEHCAAWAAPFAWTNPACWSFWLLFFTFVRKYAGEKLYSPHQGGVQWGSRLGDYLHSKGYKLLWDRDDAATAAEAGMPTAVVQDIAGSGMHVALAQVK